MKDRNLDYNSIIGLILILFVLIIFTYFNNNNTITTNNNYKKLNLNHQITSIADKRKENHFFLLENNVLKLKISSLGGGIHDVLLKKYKAYDSILSSHAKNLYLIKNSSFLYKLSFLNQKEGLNIDTNTLYFQPFLLKKNDKKYRGKTLIMRAKNPYGKGFLDYIYTIGEKDRYDIEFSIRTKNFHFENNKKKERFISYLDLEYKILSLEKDRDWENSYTQVCYSISNNNEKTNRSVKYLSEKKTEDKNLYDVNWIAYKQQFFSFIFIPEKMLKSVFVRSENFSSGSFLKKIQLKTSINSVKDEDLSFRFYFGPLDLKILKKYQNEFENIIPFGWGFLKWINKYFFLIIFQLLEKTNLNYGVIVILMTIVVKLILYPITYKQYKLSATMKLIRPEIEKLNHKYKKDVFKKQRAIMELYRNVGINPMSGCISTLFQIPIFYSLFKFFPTIINLRGKSFLWVEDLTSYDSIFKLPFFIPFYGNHVSLLTLLYSLALLIYTKLSNNGRKNFSQNENDSSIPDMNFLLYMMPIVMLLFINSYASALSLYYFTSNIINIGFFFFIKEFMLNKKKNIIKILEKKVIKKNYMTKEITDKRNDNKSKGLIE
ncbi:membrane protein insertase YidC [Blattabacterium cuenoti]|uniref:Membrane protein insertase YidC n=1 Tax=Blattabacterium cuenoti STAT TaxID=1457030 RepID=A0A224ABS6_9FLAO|nr:membrane protein insertase YidC [Blattabacterium cuenoti]BBA17336.1 inner membrane protein translocase component YidC [Blattabacterium cuenoti STAT]